MKKIILTGSCSGFGLLTAKTWAAKGLAYSLATDNSILKNK